MSTVKSVTFSSKEEQYEKLTETMGDNWKIFEGMPTLSMMPISLIQIHQVMLRQ